MIPDKQPIVKFCDVDEIVEEATELAIMGDNFQREYEEGEEVMVKSPHAVIGELKNDLVKEAF